MSNRRKKVDQFSVIQRTGRPAFTVTGAGCWLWNGVVAANGYGKRYWKGRWDMAHRAFFEKYIGPIPAGFQLDHLCRNRACVNPHHLEPVTRKENLARGKGSVVSRSVTRLTTPEQRDQAVRDIVAGKDPKLVASEFGVRTNHIYDWMQVRGVSRG